MRLMVAREPRRAASSSPLAIYVACAVAFAVVAGPERLAKHTSFNHYAQLADAWLHGRQDLAHGAPGYAQGNDFAEFEGKTYISFPPFPAVLMCRSSSSPGAPRTSETGSSSCGSRGSRRRCSSSCSKSSAARGAPSARSEINAAFALLFAFGTVYFFTAVEGTVWFAAHVVGAALLTGYMLFALDAENPAARGARSGLRVADAPADAPRRAALRARSDTCILQGRAAHRGTLRSSASRRRGSASTSGARPRVRALLRCPILGVFAIASWMNYTRYHDPSPTAFGHEYLGVAWRGAHGEVGALRLPLPLEESRRDAHDPPVAAAPRDAHVAGAAPFQINEHGLALWFTTPIYLWLFRPKTRGWFSTTSLLVLAALVPLVMDLALPEQRLAAVRLPLLERLRPAPLHAARARAIGRWRISSALRRVVRRVESLRRHHVRSRRHDRRFYFREGTQTRPLPSRLIDDHGEAASSLAMRSTISSARHVRYGGRARRRSGLFSTAMLSPTVCSSRASTASSSSIRSLRGRPTSKSPRA